MGVTDTAEWAALAARAAAGAPRLTELFASEPDRAARLTVAAAGLTIDVSKQPMDREILNLLASLAAARGVAPALAALAAGEALNVTEDRPALHMALRGMGGDAAIAADVEDARKRARAFVEAVRSGERRGATGRRLRHILHIGIGGSALGPMLLAEALKRHLDPGFELRFAANVDPAEINDALEGLDPETTLVCVVSKSFTTQETRLNAEAARDWLAATLGADAGRHVVAITARPDRAAEFGVAEDAVFSFRNWVGGRYSVWSSASLAVEIALGSDGFEAFLAGAAAMDAHARDAEPLANAPLLMALAEIWNRDFLDRRARAVIPYARRLRLLPDHLQQVEMESNGKGVTLDGASAPCPTQPIVFGAPGTDAQHAFFQQLHQGPDVVPVDFVGVAEDAEARPGQHRALTANMLAQAAALMTGDPFEAVLTRLRGEGLDDAAARRMAGHRAFPGNRPSTTILLDRLAPGPLGALMALYEHKVFFESVIWGVNAFDQWGVELGKTIASRVLGAIESAESEEKESFDDSTRRLICLFRGESG